MNTETFLENKTYDEMREGDSATLSRTLTQKDIQFFAVMSGDFNPAHLDEEYAKDEIFHKIIAHGMWGGSLISAVIGTQLPGAGTIYMEQSFKFHAPVAIGDKIDVNVTVLEKRPKGRVLLDCACVNQDGVKVISGQALVLAPSEKVRRARINLPEIEFKEGESVRHQQFINMAKEMTPLETAVVHPLDESSLLGAIEAAQAGLIDPILIGPEQKIKALAEEMGVSLDGYKIVSVEHSHAAAEKAVELVHQGKAEAIMKGKIHTQEFMNPIVSKVGGLRTGRRMSHILAVDAPNYHKSLYLTDVAVNIMPDLTQKKDIVQNAIDLCLAVNGKTPKVAIVSAVEMVNESIPSTLDATALCKMAERGQIVGGILDGPLALDNAISMESAKTKGIVSPVVGDADIIVVPDVESGNMLYKQLRYLSGIDGAGIVLGARVPVILTSRASLPITRKASSALALVYARRKGAINA